jgi:hypothetical protein
MSAPGLLLDQSSLSLERQLDAVRREIKLGKQTYPTRIATRRMSARKATEEIACMEAVAEILVELIEGR